MGRGQAYVNFRVLIAINVSGKWQAQ